MPEQIKNVFISHIHEDDEGIKEIKRLAGEHGMIFKDASITADKPNSAKSEDYIKYEILAPRIKGAGVLVVYVSRDTKDSPWVDWEIEHAQRLGKRIVGIWAYGEKDCELPKPLEDYADAVVGWNGESIIDAINGKSDKWYKPDGSAQGYTTIKRHSCQR